MVRNKRNEISGRMVGTFNMKGNNMNFLFNYGIYIFYALLVVGYVVWFSIGISKVKGHGEHY